MYSSPSSKKLSSMHYTTLLFDRGRDAYSEKNEKNMPCSSHVFSNPIPYFPDNTKLKIKTMI